MTAILYINFVALVGLFIFWYASKAQVGLTKLVLCEIIFYSGAVLALVMLAGTPRDAKLDLFIGDDPIPVIATYVVEGESIYIYALKDDEPMNYRLPFSEKMARQLHEAGREAGKTRSYLMFNPGEWVFYPAPPKESPPKTVVPEGGYLGP